MVAVLFVRPLRAGHPQSPANKILWIVRRPRRGAAPAHPRPARRVRRPCRHHELAGELLTRRDLPSIDDVPVAGCWRFTLRWAGHTDTVALRYRS